jgi:hypothetical protein
VSISRDEAREIAVVGMLITVGLRLGAGVLQLVEEVGASWTVRSATSRLFAPIGSTVGILVLASALLAVLSPRGSVTTGVLVLCRRAAATVALIGAAASVHTLAFGFGTVVARLWFAMINGLAAATLAGTAWWILRHFDGDR